MVPRLFILFLGQSGNKGAPKGLKIFYIINSLCTYEVASPVVKLVISVSHVIGRFPGSIEVSYGSITDRQSKSSSTPGLNHLKHRKKQQTLAPEADDEDN